MAFNDGAVMDLDRLIQSCEFENKQYVKLIEKENQQIEAYEREIEVKQRESIKLEEAISQLDEDTKRAHKQFTLNRDNCESLRKTMVVLMEHEVALNRKLNCLIANGEDERLQHEGIVKHYEDIYADYMVKYKTFPLVRDLAEYQEQIAAKEQILQGTQDKINTLKNQLDEAQGGSEVNFKNLNKFIIKLAEMKLDTEHAVLEKTQFEAELLEIQEKHSRQEEGTDVIDGTGIDGKGIDELPANISDDSFGEDMSTMIGIYNNKAEPDVNINNSAEILDLTANTAMQFPPADDVIMESIQQQASTPQPETAEEIPRLSDIHINAPLRSPSKLNRAPPPSPAIQNVAPVPVAADTTQNRASPLVMRMGTQDRTTPTSLTPQSASLRSPKAVLMPSFISKESKSQLLPGQSRSFIPKAIHSPQIPLFPKSTSVPTLKMKHGVSSIQTSGKQRGPSLVIPPREQRRHSASVPRLPIVLNQIRVPPKQAPAPPPTPEDQNSTEAVGASRFLSPVSEPRPRPPSLQNLTAPRKLDVGSVVTPSPIVQQPPTTPVTSHHFDKPVSVHSKSPQEAPDNVVMESPDRSTSSPTTPGQTMEYGLDPESPFNLEKHIENINLLAKSPGGPVYTQRPMFDSDGTQTEGKSPGPFLQTFSSGPNAQPSSEGRSEMDQPVSSMFSPAPDTPLSGGMVNLFGGQDKSEHPDTAETSFIFSGRSEQSDRSSSFLSMFESPTGGAKSPQNFSFNFVGDSTPTSNKSDFAFSFGTGGGEDRSPSIFNLF